MMRLGEPTSFTLFGLAAAVVIIVSLAPLLLAEDDAPTPGAKRARMNLRWLLGMSPVGFVATVLIGFANGPFWSLTPVYATQIGLWGVAVGTLMTAVTIGAAAFQFPVGRISDAVDRRFVLLGLTTLTAAFEIALFLGGRAMAGWPLMAMGLVMGGLIATQYYAASAHTNDRTGRENAVGVSAALLFLYCVGAMIGPVTASLVMEHLGASALFLHNGGIHVAIAVFVALRIWRRPGAPARSS